MNRRKWCHQLVQFGGMAALTLMPVCLFGWHRSELSISMFGPGLVALWGGLALFQQVSLKLLASPDALVLRNLPISNAATFAFQWRQSGISHACMTLPALLFGTVLLTHLDGRAGWELAAAALAGLGTWLAGIACALWILLRGWGRATVVVSVGLAVLMVLSIVPWSSKLARPLLDQGAQVGSLLLPFAWPGRMLADTLKHGPGLSLLLLMPTTALIYSIGSAWRWATCFELPEPVFSVQVKDSAEGQLAAAIRALPSDFELITPAAKAGPTELQDFVSSRAWLAVKSYSAHGWIERQLERRLTPRERTLMELILSRVPRWSKSWVLGAKCLVVAILAGLLLETFKSAWFPMGYIVGGIAGALAVLPIRSCMDRACGPYYAGGAAFTFVVGFPVAYREITRLAWKIATVRAITALPLALAFATFLCLRYGKPHDPWWLGPLFGARVVWFFWAARPFLSAVKWASGAGDSSRMSNTEGLAYLAAITAFVVFGIAGLVAVFAPHWSAVPAGLIAMGVSFGFERFYGRLVARNHFDYMVRKSDSFKSTGG